MKPSTLFKNLCCLTLLLSTAVNASAADDQKIKANENAAIASVKKYLAAQDVYRRTDWDKDGLLEYATNISGNFSLYEVKEGTGDLALVEAAFAKASARPRVLKDVDIPKSDKAIEAVIAKLIPDLKSKEKDKRLAASKALELLEPKAIRSLEKLSEETKNTDLAKSHRIIADKLRKDLKEKLGAIVTTSPKSGYCFKILTAQSAHAPGPKRSYIKGGNMLLGFALVAFPVVYGKTGRRTFIANHTGSTYQKDLGKDTVKMAAGMIEYSPDWQWVLAE